MDSDAIETVFNHTFSESHGTVLVGGADEPLYQPGRAAAQATVFYTRNYAASALHEVAHWCVAGPNRRQQEDYGYWYAPDGRTSEQQRQFEQVEVKPQALEWIFSRAAGLGFRVSADNLSQELAASHGFKQAIALQARNYVTQGLPQRAGEFARALARAAQVPACCYDNPGDYQTDEL
jgi:elongation factor P hydroxylase